MPNTRQRIEALRWAASFCVFETCAFEERVKRYGDDSGTIAAIWRSRADTFRAMADELEAKERAE